MENSSRFQNTISELREQIKYHRELATIYSILCPSSFIGLTIGGATTGYFLSGGGAGATVLGIFVGILSGTFAAGATYDAAQANTNESRECIRKISELEEKTGDLPKE